MSPHDSGVTELLRRASDDLAPDVDRLVRGGITRGRTRQRRARIGTTVASLAVIGVVGALAAVVPQGGSDSAPDRGLATEPTSATPTPTPAPTERPFAVSAADIPQQVDSMMLDLGEVSGPLLEPPYGMVDTAAEKIVHFRIRGMLTTFVAERVPQPEGVEDGGFVGMTGPTTADGVTSQGVTVWRSGYAITLLSYDAADGKDSPPLEQRPALSREDLANIVISQVWFGG